MTVDCQGVPFRHGNRSPRQRGRDRRMMTPRGLNDGFETRSTMDTQVSLSLPVLQKGSDKTGTVRRL
jgi:hypothetical protein